MLKQATPYTSLVPWSMRGKVFEPRPHTPSYVVGMFGFHLLPHSIQRLTCMGRYGVNIYGTGDEQFADRIARKHIFRPVVSK